jgi:hypothetical protein
MKTRMTVEVLPRKESADAVAKCVNAAVPGTDIIVFVISTPIDEPTFLLANQTKVHGQPVPNTKDAHKPTPLGNSLGNKQRYHLAAAAAALA